MEFYDTKDLYLGKVICKRNGVTVTEPGYSILLKSDDDFEVIKSSCDIKRAKRLKMKIFVEDLKKVDEFLNEDKEKTQLTETDINHVFKKENAKVLKKKLI